MIKRFVLSCAVAVLALQCLRAQTVSVCITTDSGFTDTHIVNVMQQRLGALLTEINQAHAEHNPSRMLKLADKHMNADSQNMLHTLWACSQFYCDDTEVVDRLWPLKDGYLLRQIPLILTPEEGFSSETYQEAVVEFDRSGNIRDFRFAMDAQVGLSMEKCGKVVEESRKLQILSYCDRFRTAYNTKDMDFLQRVFSEDALIITGNVVTTKPNDMGISQSKVTYNKQTKQQYLMNLRRAFQRNKYIEVKFSEIGGGGVEGGCGTVTRSGTNPNMYGVRLKQEWNSSNYSDVGYVFLLWDFTNEDEPMIHVRTWQPEMVGGQKMPEKDIFSLSDFDL